MAAGLEAPRHPDHPGARTRERRRHLGPDPPRGARHQRQLSIQGHHSMALPP